MIVSKAQKQPKLNRVVVAAPKPLPPISIVAASEPHASASQRQIRELAFENFEKRGSEPGHDQQDWFRAERQILAQ